jgi:hypothetical protein
MSCLREIKSMENSVGKPNPVTRVEDVRFGRRRRYVGDIARALKGARVCIARRS